MLFVSHVTVRPPGKFNFSLSLSLLLLLMLLLLRRGA